MQVRGKAVAQEGGACCDVVVRGMRKDICVLVHHHHHHRHTGHRIRCIGVRMHETPTRLVCDAAGARPMHGCNWSALLI